jgi:hypothetical protein
LKKEQATLRATLIKKNGHPLKFPNKVLSNSQKQSHTIQEMIKGTTLLQHNQGIREKIQSMNSIQIINNTMQHSQRPKMRYRNQVTVYTASHMNAEGYICERQEEYLKPESLKINATQISSEDGSTANYLQQ